MSEDRMEDADLDELSGMEAEWLTPEEQAALDAARAERQREQLVDALGVSSMEMVKEAVQARSGSGVERRWEEDLANYYGSELEAGMRGVVERAIQSRDTGKELISKSQIGVNITRPKTNAAVARIVEMATPTDERNFTLETTPDPELSEAMHSEAVAALGQDGQPIPLSAVAKAVKDTADRAATGMLREVDDQLAECDFTGELRAAYMDMVRLGTGIMAGPLIKRVKTRRWIKQSASVDGVTGQQLPAKWTLHVEDKFVPYSERVNPWDFFPDPAALGDMRSARYAVRRKYYNSRTLRELIGQPGSLDERIESVLKQGPRVLSLTGDNNRARYVDGDYLFEDKLLFEAFIVFAMFDPAALEAAGVEGVEDVPGMMDDQPVPGMVILVNGQAVRASLNPLDTGELPFDMMHYEKVDGQPWGLGIPFIIRNPQRTVRAAWRMVMENAAQNVGGQLIINKDMISPANGSWEMTGRKVWYMQSQKGKASSQTLKVEDAFGYFNPESRIDQLLKIIEFALRFAEDETSMPALLEGRQGSAPDTVGGMQLLDSRANEVLMRLIRQNDDDMLKPHLTRYVDFNMQYSDKEEIKGDLRLIPLSASAMRAKTIEAQALSLIGQYVLHPSLNRFHKSGGYEWLRRVYQLVRLDPGAILEEPDAVAQMLKQAAEQPQPEDPRITAAKINAESRAASDMARKDIALQDAETTKNVETLRFQATMAKLSEGLANDLKITTEQARARLMEVMATLSSKERLFTAEASLKMSPQNQSGLGV